MVGDALAEGHFFFDEFVGVACGALADAPKVHWTATLEPAVVYEAWCSQRPGNIIVMIEEIHGKKVRAGESFSAAHIVGYFDTIEEMHRVYERYKGHTALAADKSGWRLTK